MNVPKIFVSHSAKTDAGARILNEVCHELTNSRFEVLVDRIRLAEAVGDRWRDALNTWMELCHAAIVIVDDSAKTSPWVKQELAILTWRASRDPRFKLFPVVVPPVTFDGLRGGDFDAIGIGATEAVSSDTDYLPLLLGRCELLRTSLPPASSIDRIENLLSAWLAKADTTLMIQAASTHMGVDLGSWSPGITVHRAFARLLLGVGLPDAVPALSDLGLSVAELRPISSVLATVWVDCRAVEAVHRIANGPMPDRAIAINARRLELPRWYIQRASGSSPTWFQLEIKVGEGEDGAESIVEQVKQLLLASGPPQADARYLDYLRGPTAASGGPMVLVFEPEPDRDVLERLRQEFPSFTFFVLTGDEIPDGARDRSAAGAHFIRPELNPQNVSDALAAWWATHNRLLTDRPGGF